MTPPHPSQETPPHRLHLFLNPRGREPYLSHIHTHDENAQCTRRTIFTTSLPCSRNRSRRRPMMRTTAHNPDLTTTLTFPASSPQHQLSLMTLATHLLVSLPQLHHTNNVGNILRQADSHRHTLHLIMATVTLGRYHKVWFTNLHEHARQDPLLLPAEPGVHPTRHRQRQRLT